MQNSNNGSAGDVFFFLFFPFFVPDKRARSAEGGGDYYSMVY